MKTVYLVSGVSGSGKSWCLNNLSTNIPILKEDDYGGARGVKKILDIIYSSKESIFILEKSLHISTFLKKTESQLNVKLVIVGGDFLKVKQQLISRGGKITVSLYKRWKRMQYLSSAAILSDDSNSVLKFLKKTLTATSIVYKVTSPSNKIYIGQTYKTLSERRKSHESDAASEAKYRVYTVPFHNALSKYGSSSFTWEVLRSNLCADAANYWESFYIKLYNSVECGYNRTTGGKKTYTHVELTKRLIAKKATEHNLISWQNPERRAKAAAATERSWKDESIREKRCSRIKSIRSSPKHRKQSSEDSKKRYENPEARKAMAIACGARPFSVFDKYGTFLGEWVNAADCARALNLTTKSHISNCLHGRKKSYLGYTFIYSESIFNKK